MLDLRIIPERVAVCRLAADSAVPVWIGGTGFRSVTWTGDETSVVCAESLVPGDVRSEGGWRALMVVGPLDFGLTGILSSIARPLAEERISIFAISTFDTDYVLVKDSELERAIQALAAAGHRVD
jgi:hypothetical protein